MSNLFEIAPDIKPESIASEIEVDEAVLQQLPQGCKVVGTKGHGASLWTRFARIDVQLADGTAKSYFLTVATGPNGLSMMRGEHESSRAINMVISDFAPGPVGWGTFTSDPDLHFFLQDFHEMDQEVPDMERFTLKLSAMHLKSAELHMDMKAEHEQSPTPRFGFHVTTHNGSLAQDNRWTDTWEAFFVQGLRRMLELEEEAQGEQPKEMKDLIGPLFQKVIPRLLRPMETGGRHIKPCLIHGDMWQGNTSTDVVTNEPIVFDACCFWGHNEYDLRTMRARTRYKFGRAWQSAYLRHYPAASPAEDFDSRNALYILRSELHDSALFPGDPKFRKLFIDEAKRLFPDGYEGWLKTNPGH
ncbi:hypothetical protein BU26DRAFT_548009 [Trematosphaeria pertusa]|uniref:protein-ribulosamine 3-kinase n=1 Tax=Trematosphaeria pertusa TaxID=390896 RepID=A0A6A6ITX5_9PLEO|nr:uncharacterized protein BU26DRAFT_548009 [Trematosphaeria pertusa]KAF2253567.1 hypothetical protein BU26DRAFT_548009 [Trematosphaeria pertusa]